MAGATGSAPAPHASSVLTTKGFDQKQATADPWHSHTSSAVQAPGEVRCVLTTMVFQHRYQMALQHRNHMVFSTDIRWDSITDIRWHFSTDIGWAGRTPHSNDGASRTWRPRPGSHLTPAVFLQRRDLIRNKQLTDQGRTSLQQCCAGATATPWLALL